LDQSPFTFAFSGTDTYDVYDPEKIKAHLAQLGFTLEEPVSAAVAQEEDERLRIAEKAIQNVPTNNAGR